MTDQDYINLITKKLTKEISKEEISLLNEEISLNNENKNIYNSMLKNWQETELYKSTYKANKKVAWQKIQNKISVKEKKPETKVIAFNFKKIYKIVAIAVILLAMTFIAENTLLNNNTKIYTSSNETKNIELPDGSKIFLSENSSISYATSFEQRNVKLTGEAFFEVTKDAENPFTVSAAKTEIQVLGTSFNIDVTNKNVEVLLFTGKVKFYNKKNNSLILNPGELATYNNKEAIFSKKTVKVSNNNYWKTKELHFENTSISEVILSLENYYDIDIKINSSNDCNFTGGFENAKIEEVLEVITYSLSTDYKIENGKFIINDFSCK